LLNINNYLYFKIEIGKVIFPIKMIFFLFFFFFVVVQGDFSIARKNHIYKKQELPHLFKMTRIPKNFVPSLILNLVGACSTTNIENVIKNPIFYTSFAASQFIMSGAMIINDIFDVDVDKINNPTRPLVTKEVSILSAEKLTIQCFVFGLLFSLPLNFKAKIISLVSIIISIIYTPVLKKIVFLKNITCASLVALNVLFSSFALSNTANYCTYYFMATFFICSIHKEVLMDISDVEGDKISGIQTIPVIYGIENTKFFLNIFLLIGCGVICFISLLASRSIVYPIIWIFLLMCKK